MSSLVSVVVSISAIAAGAERPRGEESLIERPRFAIEVPSIVLTDVPVRRIVIRALGPQGNFDPTYNEQPLITGIRLAIPASDDATLGPFKNGILELDTDLSTGRKVYVAASEVVVDGGNRRTARLGIARTYRWLCLAPSAIAFVLCLWPRNFVLSMFGAVLCGAAILDRGNLFWAFIHTVDSFVTYGMPSADGGAGAARITTLTAMFLFGSLFAVIAAGGGLTALTNQLGLRATTRERGQLATLIFGMLTFFDDYASALLVGKTLRPLSDRLKISREKFAFLVNTTAASVAALAIVSSWLAAERGTIRESFASLGVGGNVTQTLIASLTYCFYPILALIFAMLLILLGHDFGPMLRAEWRAVTQGHLSRPDLSDPLVLPAIEPETPGGRALARNAWIPIVLLFGLIGVGLWWTGRDDFAAKGLSADSWLDVLERARPQRVLLFSAFLASVAAVALAVWSHAMTLQNGVSAWVSGMQRMVPAALILVLSWCFQRICDADHLNTAGFLAEVGRPAVTVKWVPLVAFCSVGLTSFVLGSSWAALAVGLPWFISVTISLLGDLNEAGPLHPLLLATVGAVIGGTVFGRHCSPVSDTAILSSASSSCSHLDHVLTQLPYALTIAVVAALFGYAPVAFGYSPVLLLPAATLVLVVIIQFGGRPAVEPTKAAEAVADPPPPDETRATQRQAAAAAQGKPARSKVS